MKARALASAMMLSSALVTGVACATQVVGAPAPGNASPPASLPSPEAMRDQSNSLTIGVIDSVDVASGRIVIQGVALRFDPSAVQVFSRSGAALSASALSKRQNVGFLLDSRDPKHATVRVIYLR